MTTMCSMPELPEPELHRQNSVGYDSYMLTRVFRCCGTPALFTSLLLAASNVPPKELPLRQPAVHSVFPLGGKAGKAVNVEIEGEFLDRAMAVRCECSDVTGAVRRAGALAIDVEINVSPSAEPGLRVMY